MLERYFVEPPLHFFGVHNYLCCYLDATWTLHVYAIAQVTPLTCIGPPQVHTRQHNHEGQVATTGPLPDLQTTSTIHGACIRRRLLVANDKLVDSLLARTTIHTPLMALDQSTLPLWHCALIHPLWALVSTYDVPQYESMAMLHTLDNY